MGLLRNGLKQVNIMALWQHKLIGIRRAGSGAGWRCLNIRSQWEDHMKLRHFLFASGVVLRSEERRVGKECA